ncbi:MAG: DUF1566 domain-containing protein [Gammaproteobacteria bacterium]|nr:DUF1566 domain-containing protein [Gammaproteobacteria bacterium]
MRTLKTLASAAVLLTTVTVSSMANAALLGRLPTTLGGTDYQAYYDDVADLTWLADANAGAGSTFDDGPSITDGKMRWVNANAWAGSLNVSGVTGWRLPDTLQPDTSCDSQSSGGSYGYNCTGSEMGSLYYNALGNSAYSLANTDSFSNVKSDYYWSATEYSSGTYLAWYFYMYNGRQFNNYKTDYKYAWAVRSGDVSAVPVPAAMWLLGSGLLGLIGVARRK